MGRPRAQREERDQLSGLVRFDILSRDGFTCQACGAQPGNSGLEVDHLLLWSLGGSDDPLNLCTLCRACNRGKLDRIWIPPRLMFSNKPDADGFSIWKRFGTWNIEVGHGGIIANWWPDRGGYVWFAHERCWEMDWVDHFDSKSVHKACDCEDKAYQSRYPKYTPVSFQNVLAPDYEEPDRGPRDLCTYHGLIETIDFLRAINRRSR